MALISIPNPTKELLRAGKVALGMNVRLARSGDIARIAKSTGHDFIFIDVIHIGSNDLLAALGAPGTFGSPQHLEAVDRVFAAAKRHGRIPGIGGDRNVARQAEFIRKGARFITTNSEIAFILAEGSRVTGELRKAIGG